MNILYENNFAILSGEKITPFKHYYKRNYEEYLIAYIKTERQSGRYDILPIVISEKLLDDNIKSAPYISVEGQIRTYNRADGSLETYLFAKHIEVLETNTSTNIVKLTGYICKKRKYRVTYTQRRIMDFVLACNRAYKKSDYIPIIAWGKDANYVNNNHISTKLNITGRFQSRKYIKKDKDGNKIDKYTYEISASNILAVK